MQQPQMMQMQMQQQPQVIFEQNQQINYLADNKNTQMHIHQNRDQPQGEQIHLYQQNYNHMPHALIGQQQITPNTLRNDAPHSSSITQRHSVNVRCYACQNSVMSQTSYVHGTCSYLLMCVCLPFACCIAQTEEIKDVLHTCPDCNVKMKLITKL